MKYFLIIFYSLFFILINAQHNKYAPIINSYGDTVSTGKHIDIQGITINPDSVLRPKIIKATATQKSNTNTNIHKLKKSQIIYTKPSTPNLDSLSFSLINSFGDTIPTGIPIPTQGKIILTKQPKSITALPTRFKDITNYNIQYLDVDQGMASSYIYSMIEDKRGNIWFGTYGGGVSCYNGKTLLIIQKKKG